LSNFTQCSEQLSRAKL